MLSLQANGVSLNGENTVESLNGPTLPKPLLTETG